MKTAHERPAWVDKALAWMRQEYQRSTDPWMQRFEATGPRPQPSA